MNNLVEEIANKSIQNRANLLKVLKRSLRFEVPKGFTLKYFCKGNWPIRECLKKYLNDYRLDNQLDKDKMVIIPLEDITKMYIFKKVN
jgi:hypothetical protein